MKISNAKFDTIKEGSNTGKLALIVTFGEDISVSAVELATLIKEKFKKTKLKTNLVVFDLSVSVDGLGNDYDDIDFLFSALRDSKYAVIGILNGSIYYTGQDYFDYIIALLTNTEWKGYKVNEIIYYLNKQLKEPFITPINNRPDVHIYIKSDDQKAILSFLKKSKYPWGIIGEFKGTLNEGDNDV